MKIESVSVAGFRGYDERIEIPIPDLCVFVGPNDIGKSTILEALDIFFNDGKGCVKLDKDDINKAALSQGRTTIEIAVEFSELPDEIVIDATNRTTLASEYLLTENGTLKVVKRYPNAGKPLVFIRARHPVNAECQNLLLKKHSELKRILEDQGLNCSDKSKSAEIRKAIWSGQGQLHFDDCDIDVAKLETKQIWERLRSYLPLYTLFRSDRENTESDSEVQDPMRLAVRQIMEDPEIQKDLDAIAGRVRDRLAEVAEGTLEKLNEMNPELAESLSPRIPPTSDLKWAEVFKNVSVTGDEEIPLNKRGSGVKRLVLLNFFRAEADRRQREAGGQYVVYAIEEPETSQHPDHQRLLTNALAKLAESEASQVLVTTHSPEIVKQLRFEDLLLISGADQKRIDPVKENDLPYPSLNEVNYVAFGEASAEYHNELYGHIEVCGLLDEYSRDKSKIAYRRERKGRVVEEQKTLTEYIRHQIHHPENTHNERYSSEALEQSIEAMREFLRSETGVSTEI